MKINSKIPKDIIAAAHGLLSCYVQGLTPSTLIKALESYSESPVEEVKPQKMYRINEFCKMLGVSRPTLYRNIREGRIRTVRICGVQRIPAEEYNGIINKKAE